MEADWRADLDSASWIGRDLKFRAVSEAGENEYIIPGERLRDVAQRTGPEALSLNLPLLRSVLISMSRGARPGQTLTLTLT
ncbi:MAG: hypothetical protein EOO77_35480 [Oxalobacteraceae bacterium]|nr:MAG: hypothetical protein EOO77_35480 [Oxalobacteraceae bacterium]